MSWHRIDEQREISADFITCAEYQLFLDEKRAQGEYRQPDHWNDEQFPKGQAQEPILGVRGEDAEQFCEWLSQRQGSRFRYRLPTLEDISNNPMIARGDIGCWCMAEEKRLIHGVNLTQLQEWRELFLSALTDDWDCLYQADTDTIAREYALAHSQALELLHQRDHAFARNIYNSHALALAINENPDLIKGLASKLDRTLAVAGTHARVLVRALGIDHALHLESALGLERTLGLERALRIDCAGTSTLNVASVCTLDFDLDLCGYLAKNLGLAFTLARDLTRTLTHAIACAHDRDFISDHFSVLRNLCCILIMLHISVGYLFFSSKLDQNLYRICRALYIFEGHDLLRSKLAQLKRLWSNRTEIGFGRSIDQGLGAVFDCYAFSFLIDERRKGNLPAWEGIRIVRERLE